QGLVSPHELHPTLAAWLDRLELLPPVYAKPRSLRWGIGSLAWWAVGLLDVAAVLAVPAAFLARSPLARCIALGAWAALWVLPVPFLRPRRGAFGDYLKFQGRRVVFALLFWAWFGVLAGNWVSEFLHYHRGEGLMNHALLQLPHLPSEAATRGLP